QTRRSRTTGGEERLGYYSGEDARGPRARPEHRDHGSHRRRQDDDDRAHPLLHRPHPQDGRGARGRRGDGLDGAGAGSRDQEHFRGVVDLVEMKAIVWTDDLGTTMQVEDIPAELVEQAREYHHQLIDSVADHDDELTETYLEDEDSVTPDMLRRALRKATLDI